MFKRYILLLMVVLAIFPGAGFVAHAASEFAPSAPRHDRKFAFRSLPLGNLVYQLNCIAGEGHCSKEAFQELWQQWGWNSEDQAYITEWQRLRTKYNKQLSFSQPAAVGFPLRFEGIDVGRKLRMAGLLANDWESYQMNLNLLLSQKDSSATLQILHHFWPRFEHWWLGQAEAKTTQYMDSFTQLLNTYHLFGFIDQMAAFYEAELPPESLLSFNFMLRPASKTYRNFYGEQLENHSIVEVWEEAANIADIPLDKKAMAVGVILHELSHYLYKSSPTGRHSEFVKRFVNAPEPYAMRAYNLLDEVVATAMGNGLVTGKMMTAEQFQKYYQTPGSFYNDRFIEPVAKAFLPDLQQFMLTGKTIYSEAFIQAYLKAFRIALGASTDSPVLALRTMALAYDGEGLKPVVSQFQESLRVGSSWGSNAIDTDQSIQNFAGFPLLSGGIFLYSQRLTQLKRWEQVLGPTAFNQLSALMVKQRAVVYGIKRSPQAFVFIFIGQDRAALEQAIAAFSQKDQLFEGAGIRL